MKGEKKKKEKEPARGHLLHFMEDAWPPFDPESGELNVIIETPKGSRNKFKFDDKRGVFRLASLLTAGMVFPFDFGYVTSTKAEDGDPLDVLVLMDEPAFTGCFVPCRPIGVIEMEQTEDGATVRNDRVLAVACKTQLHAEINDIDDLDAELLNQIEHFFRAYTEMQDKKVNILGRKGPKKAVTLIRAASRSTG